MVKSFDPSIMVNDTLNDILVKVSAIVSQTTTVTDTSDEYTLWRSFVNQAQKEWADRYEWPQLYVEYHSKFTSTGNTSLTLPANYRMLAGFPVATADGTNTYEFPEIDPQTKKQYSDDDRYCYILHSSTGTTLIFNPASIVSGASYMIPYWKSPASLVSPANAIDCPDPNYLVQRTIAHIWESREDSRFQTAKSEAEMILANMVEFETARGWGYDSKIKTPEEKSYNFRIGND